MHCASNRGRPSRSMIWSTNSSTGALRRPTLSTSRDSLPCAVGSWTSSLLEMNGPCASNLSTKKSPKYASSNPKTNARLLPSIGSFCFPTTAKSVLSPQGNSSNYCHHKALYGSKIMRTSSTVCENAGPIGTKSNRLVILKNHQNHRRWSSPPPKKHSSSPMMCTHCTSNAQQGFKRKQYDFTPRHSRISTKTSTFSSTIYRGSCTRAIRCTSLAKMRVR